MPSIISGRHYFQHQLTQAGICGGESAREEARQRLRTLDQRIYSLVLVRGLRIGSKVGEVTFRLREDLFPCLLKHRLLEAAIVQFAGEVADGGELSAGHGDDPVEQ